MRIQSICLAFFVLLRCPSTSAQWVPTNGPYGGEVRTLAALGTNLFAETPWGGRVFHSTNSGASWTLANTPFSDFSQMVRFGTNLYAGTGSGVYLSTDNGISWTAASDGLTDTNVISLAVSGTNLFAGCFMYGKYDGNMFLSTDNGVSWNLANTGLTSLVNALAVSGTNLSLGAGGGVSISTNRDGTWTPVNIALTSLMFRLLQSAVQISLPGLTETISLHDDRCD